MEHPSQTKQRAATTAGGNRKRQGLLLVLLIALAGFYGSHLFRDEEKVGRVDKFGADYVHFFDAVRKADAIANPLQRCLAYPDLPGTPWNAATTRAYCIRQNPKTLTLAEIGALLAKGQAAEVDRQFQSYFDAQRHGTEKVDLLDSAMHHATFDDNSEATRRIIDEWKQQSPDSPFALAASGIQYVVAADDARGEGWASQVSRQNAMRMFQLQALARQDLDGAVQRQPALAIAYTYMIVAGSMVGDLHYVAQAGSRGVAAEPYNFLLRKQMMEKSQERWGSNFGGVEAQRLQVQAMVAEHPLLRMIAQMPMAYRATCDCGEPRLWVHVQVENALKDNLNVDGLKWVGHEMYKDDPKLAAEIYAESLRFSPVDTDALRWRAETMLAVGDGDKAIIVLKDMVDRYPSDLNITAQLARMYRKVGRPQESERAYLAILERDGDNQEAKIQLGDFYNHEGRQPDKAKALADDLISRHPDNPYGYIVRACHQMDHGLPESYVTIHYFIDRFGQDPRFREQVRDMRNYLDKHPEPAAG